MNKKKGQKQKKRVNRKKKYATNSKMIIYKNVKQRAFLPPKYRTALTCNVMGQLEAGVGSASDYFAFWLNGIYHPMDTGLTTITTAPGAPLIYNISPAGSDKLSAIYSKYRVTACKCQVMVLPTSAADEIVFALAPALPGMAALSVDQVDAVSHSVGPKFSGTYFKSSLSKYLKVSDVIGNKISGDLSQLISNVNANPALQVRWDLAYRTLSNADITSTIGVAIKLTYYVDFFELKTNNIEPS